MANTYTFADAQDAVYEQLRASPATKESNRVFPLNLIKKSINDAHQRVLNKKNYTFLNETYNFNTSVDTAIATDILKGATSLTLSDSSGLATTGRIAIQENIIPYTGNSSNILTGVTNVQANYDSGEKVKQVYSIATDLLITDFRRPVSLFIAGEELEYYDYRGSQNVYGYTVYDGNLYIPIQSKANVAIFKYAKNVVDLTSDEDTFLIPDDYVTLVVEYALYKANKQIDDDKSIESFNEYKRIAEELQADYSNQTGNKKKSIKNIYTNRYNNNFNYHHTCQNDGIL